MANDEVLNSEREALLALGVGRWALDVGRWTLGVNPALIPPQASFSLHTAFPPRDGVSFWSALGYFTGVSVKSLTVTPRLPSLTAKLRMFCPLLMEISTGRVCCHIPTV